MCGLVGYIPKKKEKINILRFKSLLLYNETRGKESVGIYNSEGVVKDIISATEFSKARQWHDLKKDSIFLGHTRQPTLGYPVTMHGAQPIAIGNIVMIHNGSIYNEVDLAKKYGVDVARDDTDSVIMAKILETKQYEVLKDYNGAAALIWVYLDEPDNLYIYKGESLSRTTSKTITVERPLFTMMSDEGLYVSSLEDSLESIALDKDEEFSIAEVPSNIVFRIKKGSVDKREIVFKSGAKRSQTEIYYTPVKTKSKSKTKNKKSTKSNSSVGKSRGSEHSMYSDEYDDYYDMFNHMENFNHYWYENSKGVMVYGDPDAETVINIKTGEVIKAASTNDENASYDKETLLLDLTHHLGHTEERLFNDPVFYNIGHEEAQPSILPLQTVYYNKGRYWMNKRAMNGIYNIDNSGMINPNSKSSYAFIDGVLIKDSAVGHADAIARNITTNQHTYGSVGFAYSIRKHTDMPIPFFSEQYNCIVFCSSEMFMHNGLYSPKFLSRGIYEFTYGYYSDIIPHSKFSIGDILETKDDEVVEVTEILTNGIRGMELGSTTISYIETANLANVLRRNIQEVSAKEKQDSEVKDIIKELVDDLKDKLDALEGYQYNQLALTASTYIENFIENKLAM